MKLSVEIYPPKSGDCRDLAVTFVRAGARHISVTYGAGGSSRERSKSATLGLAYAGVPVSAHITAAGQSREEIDQTLSMWFRAGIRRFVALRGDGDGPGEPFRPHPDGYASSLDLIARVRDLGAKDISVAAYPNGHPDSRGPDADLDFLKQKRDAGATEAITQFFFNSDDYFRFRDRCTAANVGLDIVPGIMPVFEFVKVAKFAKACGEPIPQWVTDRFAGLDADPDVRRQVAVATAVSLCERLDANDVSRIHVYSCNQAELAVAIARVLAFPEAPAKAA